MRLTYAAPVGIGVTMRTFGVHLRGGSEGQRILRAGEARPAEVVDAVSWSAAAPPESPSAARPSGSRDEERKSEGIGGKRELTPDQLKFVLELQRRDLEVRAHENAHRAAGGALAGAPRYDYQMGPDGRQYAIGGEVSIRVPNSDSPEQSIRDAQQVRAAALAPAQPSGQDLSVAASASAVEQRARQELAEATRERLQSREAGESAFPVELRIESELRKTRGGFSHSHFESSCGTCSASALKYRAAM